MKELQRLLHNRSRGATRMPRTRGFSLIELVVAMAVFMVVAGAAFTLFNKHLAMVNEQQNLSGLNLGMRNALSQLEIDLAGAGTNLFSNVPSAAPVTPFSLGVIVKNNTPAGAGACAPNASWGYPTNKACFDSMTIVYPSQNNCPVLSLAANAPLTGGALTADDTGANLAADAACYQAGDEILVVQFVAPPQQSLTCDNDTFPYCMGVTTLSANGAVAGAQIQLTINAPGAGSDPLGIVYQGGAATNYFDAQGLKAATTYSAGSTYIVDLGTGANDITYSVQPSATVAGDDQLVRCTGAACTNANAQVLTDQVIGFKVGVILWDNYKANATDEANYFYDTTQYCTDALLNGVSQDCTVTPPPANDRNDFSMVRSVRISMIGRTPPTTDRQAFPNLSNGFDGGPYLVQQGSVAVDLRSITNSNIQN